MYSAGRSDIGQVRSLNEDSIFVSEERVGPLENLFVVADGLGGHNGGEVASAMAVERFAEFLEESWREGREKGGPLDAMMGALSYANACVLKRAEDTPELYGMGTTFSACSLTGGKLFIVHIGDSRIYRVTKDAIVQITDDHSYVNEMVKAGRMTKEQAAVHPQKNIITKALGLDYDIEADGIVNEADADCVLLLCSDGLTDMLSDRDIFAMANNDAALDARAEAFVAEANRRGGVDNVSVVLVAVSKDRVKAGCQDEA